MNSIPFYVKCAGCGTLYDSKHLRCPECDANRIVKRIFWTKKDLETESRLKEAVKDD